MYSFVVILLLGFALVSLLSTTYLYSYPLLHGCAFPAPYFPETNLLDRLKEGIGLKPSSIRIAAPFRLLALGDPQLEGDSSLPNPDVEYLPCLQTLLPDLYASRSISDLSRVIRVCLVTLFTSDIPNTFQYFRKRLDLLGNDYYLAHIYRTVHWFTKPTHVAVLGDLLGSQWVSDEEFERRGWRYWQRVFRHGQRVDDDLTGRTHLALLGYDKNWQSRIINVAGNHDIGYAGDMTKERIERFERVFGKANWEVRFNLDDGPCCDPACLSSVDAPELRIVVLNSLNLDTPALSQELQKDTYRFVNDVISSSRPVEDQSILTVVLTHLPLHKEVGLCADGPHFDFYDEDRGSGVKEQNHLSYNTGKGILEGIFGMSGNPDGPGGGLGRNGIILTGHDHEGCDVYHYLPRDSINGSQTWKAVKWADSDSHRNATIPGIREITVRSMMGEFGGNAGLLSAWFDHDVGNWIIDYSTCPLGIQHNWWAVHVLNGITTIGILLSIGVYLSRRRYIPSPTGNFKSSATANPGRQFLPVA